MQLTDADVGRLSGEIFNQTYVDLVMFKLLHRRYGNVPHKPFGSRPEPVLSDRTIVPASDHPAEEFNPFIPAHVTSEQLRYGIHIAVQDAVGNVARHVHGLGSGLPIPTYTRWQGDRGLYVVEGEPWDVSEAMDKASEYEMKIAEIARDRTAGVPEEELNRRAIALFRMKDGFNGGIGLPSIKASMDAAGYTLGGRFLVMAVVNDPARLDRFTKELS